MPIRHLKIDEDIVRPVLHIPLFARLSVLSRHAIGNVLESEAGGQEGGRVGENLAIFGLEEVVNGMLMEQRLRTFKVSFNHIVVAATIHG